MGRGEGGGLGDSPREMVMVNTAVDARRFHEKDALFLYF